MERTFKPRLQRLRWIFTDCPVYFVTVCTDRRRSILAADEVHKSFNAFAARALDYQVHVGRYVLMPDHAHFFAAFGRTSLDVDEVLEECSIEDPPANGGPGPTLGKRLLRSCDAFGRILRGKMAVCGAEPGPGRPGSKWGGLALSGRNTSPNGVVAAVYDRRLGSCNGRSTTAVLVLGASGL